MNKKTLVYTFSALIALSISASAQSDLKPACNPKSCGPESTKTEEAKVISGMRNDLQMAVGKLAKLKIGSNQGWSNTKISKGENDDESLLFIYQTAFSVHAELLAKLDSEKLLPEFKSYNWEPIGNKQQLVAILRKEIKLLNDQVDRL